MAYRYRYIITDSQSAPLARAILETPPDESVWRVRVLDDDMDQVLEHEVVQLIAMNEENPAMAGRILEQVDDETVTLEPVNILDEGVRRNLRVPVRFDSFIYPVSGKWRGQLPVISHDLSCGGTAFYCNFPLEPDEIVELVIPITTQPVIVQVQIIRVRPSNSNIPLFSASFVDLIEDEETMIREAVFTQQIANHARNRAQR